MPPPFPRPPVRPNGSFRSLPQKASSCYEEKDSDPIRLQAGDEIRVGAADRTWPGWVWAVDGQGNDGYVPEEILKPLGDERFQAREAFDPTVLTIRRGDRLESVRQIHGWHWCRNESGGEGWVAGYLLRPECSGLAGS